MIINFISARSNHAIAGGGQRWFLYYFKTFITITLDKSVKVYFISNSENMKVEN